jgi:methionine-gamma-lyase
LHDLDAAEQAFKAFEHGDLAETEPIYARLHNPTVGRFERALAQLEGTEAAVAFGSGMAAITACLLAARADGEHVAALRPLYGGTDGLLASGLLGLDVSWARTGAVRRSLHPATSLVLLETPQNPTMGLVDIAAVVDAAAGIAVLVDNTFATPVLQNPARHGASLIVHSATKYLGGHGDVVGGVVATSEAWARRLRRVRILTGALMHPLAAYLLLRAADSADACRGGAGARRSAGGAPLHAPEREACLPLRGTLPQELSTPSTRRDGRCCFGDAQGGAQLILAALRARHTPLESAQAFTGALP